VTEYFNAGKLLPARLVAEILEHVPREARNGALIYVSDDFYARRNAEIRRCFDIQLSDPTMAGLMEIYEALSEEYGLTVRQICRIVKDARDSGGEPVRRRRRYSGIRVGRVSRRVRVRTEAKQ
jgi:hypothetical protein